MMQIRRWAWASGAAGEEGGPRCGAGEGAGAVGEDFGGGEASGCATAAPPRVAVLDEDQDGDASVPTSARDLGLRGACFPGSVSGDAMGATPSP